MDQHQSAAGPARPAAGAAAVWRLLVHTFHLEFLRGEAICCRNLLAVHPYELSMTSLSLCGVIEGHTDKKYTKSRSFVEIKSQFF